MTATRLRIGHDVHVRQVLEFWPEYTSGPLWRDDGQPADLDSLPLSPDLRDRLRQWNSRYDDSRLPFDQNDVDWLTEGRILLADTRADLGEAYDIVATEPWWGEEPGPLALPSQS